MIVLADKNTHFSGTIVNLDNALAIKVDKRAENNNELPWAVMAVVCAHLKNTVTVVELKAFKTENEAQDYLERLAQILHAVEASSI